MRMIQSRSKKFLASVAVLFMVLFGIMINGCGGGGGGGVAAPGAPENFQITDSTASGMVTLTLTWDAPTTGGEPTSYEIYRSDTNVSVFDPANHYITLSAETFEFVESFAMDGRTASYWVVAAKNAGGETPSQVEAYEPMGGDEGYGNNFSAAMIFADRIGISGNLILGTWTKTIALIDTATGLRPSDTEKVALIGAQINTLPYLNTDPAMTYEMDGVTYYKQQTVSTWQGQWISTGFPDLQTVTAKWGDNLVSQTSLTTNSTVRIEMVLTKAVDTNMTTYNMESLYGSTRYEVYGTDGNETNTTTAFVFAANAHLKIERLDGPGGTPVEEIDNQPIFDPLHPTDGPGKFAAEINVAGNLTYGYVWDLKQDNTLLAGTYRITFSLDALSQKLTLDNTDIGVCSNGTLVDPNTCYIEINIGE